ncbi:hypothetical protein JNUCC0626_19855 [Lentzea sp. JNUCC 0626]|uniref:hypothetical protein n=1 Tax=Lentzea sp. JNUCC 0626 TaxID=3367513 RepID=UPI003749952A
MNRAQLIEAATRVIDPSAVDRPRLDLTTDNQAVHALAWILRRRKAVGIAQALVDAGWRPFAQMDTVAQKEETR